MAVALALCSLQLFGASTQGPTLKQHEASSRSQRELQAPGFQEEGFCGMSGLAKEEFLMKGASQEAQCVNMCIDDPQCVAYEITAIEHAQIRCRTFDKLIARSNAAAPDAFRGACMVKETALAHTPAELKAGLKASSELKAADFLSTGGFSALANAMKVKHIDIQGVAATAVDGFDLLEEVEGDIVISDVMDLTRVSFPLLKKVGGSVKIERNGADGQFAEISMPELTTVGMDLIIGGNGATLCDIDLRKLMSVDGQIKIKDSGSGVPPSTVCELSLPSLTTVGFNPLETASSLDISSMAQLKVVSVDKITSVQDGVIRICDLPNLVDLSMSNLTNAYGLTLSRLPSLAGDTGRINFESLATVTYAIALEHYPKDNFVAFRALMRVGILALGHNTVGSFSNLQGFESLKEIKHALVLYSVKLANTGGLDSLMTLGSSSNELAATDGVFEINSEVDWSMLFSAQLSGIKGGFYIGGMGIIEELGVPKSTLFPKSYPVSA